MAWHNTVGTERKYTGNMVLNHLKHEVLSVSTSRDKVTELWAMLKYSALIDNRLDDIFKSKGVHKPKRQMLISEVRSYIEQSENFYTYALNSDYRSAALLYYYSFLNLAKASLIINTPALSGNMFHHGMKREMKSGLLKNRSLSVIASRPGFTPVFNELYNQEYGLYLPSKKSIGLEHILGYITDISYETAQIMKKYSAKTHSAKLYAFHDKPSDESWLVILTESGFYPANYPKTYSNFVKQFERVKPEDITTQFVYELTTWQRVRINFSQSKITYPVSATRQYPLDDFNKQLQDCFGQHYQDAYFENSNNLHITDPLRKNWQIPFNEPLSIYLFMYYLSEVVRYSPTEFDNQFSVNNAEGWLIKNFIESSPYTCLSYLASQITGKAYIFTPR